VALSIPGEREPVVAGFRDDGRLSIYFGGDEAFHFDPQGRLRRAFAKGYLFRTQGHTLARLMRVRTELETELQRHDLPPVELNEFLSRVRQRLLVLARSLQRETATVIEAIPAGTDLRPALCARLAAIQHSGIVLASPISRRT
jgi:hypothetical protein